MQRTCFDNNSNMISAKLKQLRDAAGMSQETLAAQMQTYGISIDQQMISRIERNKRLVKDYEFAVICQIFKVTERELLSDFYEKYSN
ncbi:MAG: helix-turn-helix transcriptional regulator [Ruminococcaceae bacterium]|nr:helix-turn-helix transcriptional regulator [Oscillospiraceae bacterium]